MGGAAHDFLPVVLERDGDPAPATGDRLELRAREKLDAFIDERLLHHVGGGLGVVTQDVRAALDQGHPGADPVEVLREFAGHDAAAEHEHARRHEIQVEHVVACPARRVLEAGHRRHAHLGAGAEQEELAADPAPVGELQRVRVGESGVGAVEIEFARFQRLHPVGSEVSDDFQFAGVDGLHVGAGAGDLQAEPAGVLRVMQDLGGIDQGLGRHATAQDAQAAELFRPVDDGDLFPQARRHARRVEAGAAAPDADEIVGFYFSHGSQGWPRMPISPMPGEGNHRIHRMEKNVRLPVGETAGFSVCSVYSVVNPITVPCQKA